MQDWHKIAIALVALALAYCIYKRQPREQMMMVDPSAMPSMDSVVPVQTGSGGLMPADTDPTDYGPFAPNVRQCQVQEPYTA